MSNTSNSTQPDQTPKPAKDAGKEKQWDAFSKSLDKVIGKKKGDGSNLA